MITMVGSISVNGVIGLRGVNQPLWKSEIDLAFLKENIEGNNLVMGHNTYKTFRKILGKGKIIVLSKKEKPGYRNGAQFYNSMSEIISDYDSLIVIGGEAIYNLFLPVADEIIITTISLNFEGEAEYAAFPLENMEKQFFMVKESEVISDTDTVSGLPINLIYTRWHRGITNIH